MRLLFVFLFILVLVPVVVAKEYSMPLLAVKEVNDRFEGSSAYLYLELKEGKGRVFLDTYPLTKLDTQMSTRFAKEVVCSQNDFNCDNYDFIYTIKSGAVIVGGPSAGAAIALITIAALEDLKLNQNITITGTINSGGLIGPVGGLKEKIDAAAGIGIKTVLIPNGERITDSSESDMKNATNESLENSSKIDLVEYGSKLGIKIIEVSTIDEALFFISGKEMVKTDYSFTINPRYIETMKKVAEDLCNRSSELKKEISIINLSKEDKDIYEDVLNLSNRSLKAFENGKYYSAASYCFGSNTKMSYLIQKSINPNKSEMLRISVEIKSEIKNFSEGLETKNISTITDLETYMVVKERLIEAEQSIDNMINSDNLTEKISLLAYSIERLNSAYSWSNFFNTGEKKFIIDKDEIQKSCVNKIAEAEERLQYLRLLTEMDFSETEKEINLAREDFENSDYELCLFKASKAKADSDTILNMIGVEESNLLNVTEKKLEIIKRNIIKSQEKGIFPVIGYSYYEYADDLKDKDIYSSILFAEYSLELSNLDIYFKDSKRDIFNFNIEKNVAISFILIFISGLFIGLSIGSRSKKKKR